MSESGNIIHGDESGRPGEATETSESAGSLLQHDSGTVEVTASDAHDSSKKSNSKTAVGAQVGSLDAATSRNQHAGAELVQESASGSAYDASVFYGEDSSKGMSKSNMTGSTEILNADRNPGLIESEIGNPRKELSDGTENLDKAERIEETNQEKLREFVDGAFASPHLSVEKKLVSETTVTRRWNKAYEFAKKTNEIKRQALSSPLGNGARVHGHAFGVLGTDSELRMTLFNLLYNEKTEYFLLVLIMSHLCVLILRAENVFVTSFHPRKQSLNAADLSITIIYTIECICRIVTLGFYRGPHAYLRDPFNRLDIIIVVDSWAHNIRIYALGEDAWIRLAVLRIFRALLVLRHFRFIGDIFAIIDTCRRCFVALKMFMVLTLMFLSFFALLGVQLFGGAFHTRCQRMTDREPTYPTRFCFRGWVRNVDGIRYGDNCNHLNNAGVGLSVCMYGPNPNYGSTNFDNFASSLLIVYQVITFEGWTQIMKWANITTGLGADAYFIVLVIVGGYFLVNIYIAVISGVFLKVRHEHRILLKRYRRDKPLSFSNVVKMASLLKDVILSDDAKLTWSQRLRPKTIRLSHEFSETINRQSTKLRRTMKKAVVWNDPNSYMQRNSSFGLTGIDETVDVPPELEDPALLRTLRRTLSRNLSYVARHGHNLEIVLLVIFGVELLVRVFAGGFREFVGERINVLDFVVVVIGFFHHGPNRKFLNPTPIRMLRWFYIKRDPDSRIHRGGESIPIMAAILRSVGHLGAVYMFLFLVIVIFSIFSMELWGGQMNFDDGYPRANHDSFGQAILLWFTVTTGESWVEYMWDAMRPEVENRWVAPYIFTAYFCITSIMVLNLIIATILEETELTDNQKKYMQKKEHLQWLRTKHYHHVSYTRQSDWLIDAVEGAEKGLMDIKRRITRVRISCRSIFPSSRSETPGTGEQQEQQTDESTLETTTVSSSMEGPISNIATSEDLTTARQSSDSAATAGSIEGDDISQAKVVRRSSISEGVSSIPVVRPRRASLEFDRLMVRSGFSNTSFIQGESRTALQSISPASPSETSNTEEQQEQQADESAPTTATERSGNSMEGTSNSAATFDDTTAEQLSDSAAGIAAGSTEGDNTSQPKIVPLSNINEGVSSLPAVWPRRASQQLDPLLVRSGFTNMASVEGESRTALQSAVLAVIDEKAKAAASSTHANDASTKTAGDGAQPSGTAAHLGRRKSGRNVSFVLSEFETSPKFVVRAVPWWMNDRSLFLFGPNNMVRVYIIIMVEQKAYKLFVYTYLILGMYCLQYFSPVGLWLETKQVPRINIVFTVSLCIDVLLKCIAYGFLFTHEAYMSDPYNWFDIPAVWFAIMKCILGFYGSENEKWQNKWNVVTGCFMATRPLMIISRFMGLRNLMTNILRTMPVIAQVFVFIIVVYAIFAVLGVQLYAGRFRSCTDPSVEGHHDCVGLFRNEMGILAMRTWVNPPFHFDTFGEAMLSLFIGSTFDKWPEYFLFTSMDIAHERELQPQRNMSPAHALFFLTFMCIGGFFILRMFVGVFVDQFGVISGSKLMTERQQLWRDTNRLIQGLKPKVIPTEPTGNRLRRFCFHLVYSRKFELTVMSVITINYLYMTTRHVTSDNNVPADMYDDGGRNSGIETMFVCLYALEAILKFLGTRLPDWLDDKWNVIELTMLIISASCLYPELTKYGRSENMPDLPGVSGMVLLKYPARQFVGAAFIFARIFRIIRYLPGMRVMVTPILIALPAMIDTMALMFVWLCFLMVIGYIAFEQVKTGNCITRRVGPNFENMPRSFSLMMQIMTLDNWSCLLTDMTVQPPYCNAGRLTGLLSDCGRPVWGIVFMLLSVALTTYMFANIFVAQILDTVTFSLIHENTLLAPAHIIAFRTLWSQQKYDPKCTGYIGQHKLKEFLIDLGSPLGGRRPNFHRWYTRIESEAQHFRSGKGIAFRPLLETVCLYKVGARGLELPIRIEREREIHGIYQTGAANKIQAFVRGFLHRRRNRRDSEELSKMTEGKNYEKEGEDFSRSAVGRQQPMDRRVSCEISTVSSPSTSEWASVASDIYSEKTPLESSGDSDDSMMPSTSTSDRALATSDIYSKKKAIPSVVVPEDERSASVGAQMAVADSSIYEAPVGAYWSGRVYETSMTPSASTSDWVSAASDTYSENDQGSTGAQTIVADSSVYGTANGADRSDKTYDTSTAPSTSSNWASVASDISDDEGSVGAQRVVADSSIYGTANGADRSDKTYETSPSTSSNWASVASDISDDKGSVGAQTVVAGLSTHGMAVGYETSTAPTLDWISAISDTYSEKTAIESSVTSDDEGNIEAQMAVAGSSVYETPLSHTPTNEADSSELEIETPLSYTPTNEADSSEPEIGPG